MQTVSSLADRLDMRPEQAVETLRYMLFDVEGVDSVISDEQCDLLIDADDDPEVAERIRAKKLKERDKEKKRAEKRRAAAKKGAETRKRKAAAKKKTSTKKGTKAEEQPVAEIIREEEPVAEAPAETPAEAPAQAQPEAAAEVVAPEDALAAQEEHVDAVDDAAAPEAPVEQPMAEILPPEPQETAETAAPGPEGAEPGEAQTQETTAEKPSGTPEQPGLVIGSAVDSDERTVQVTRPDGSERAVEEVEAEPEPAAAEAEEAEEEPGVSEEAEERLETKGERERKEERQRAAGVSPDPEVVAEVKRRAAERARKKTGPEPDQRVARAPAPQKPQRGGKPGRTGKTARKRQKRAERQRSEEELRRDAAATVREMQAASGPGGGRKRKRKRDRESGEGAEETTPQVIEVEEGMTVEALAEAMDVNTNDLILELMEHDVLANKNQSLGMDLIRELASQWDYEVRSVIPEEADLLAEEPDPPESLKPRAPVITVMGHVDHGKTTLLDHIRTANVAEGEAGGITQHIAAYEVTTDHGRIVFLDTPGHEAFTQMRARGAQSTDLVVLVVAADDGVMPQTVEAIDHARAAEVPIVVAVNKIDKPEAQPDRIRQDLTRYELVDEQWGGSTIMRDISAKNGDGVDDLMEMLALESEMLELKANPDKRARGIVIESEIARGQGPVAWVLVQQGTLRAGDHFLVGQTYGRVRTLQNYRGQSIEEAGPSTPVVVTGLGDVADAGDQFLVVEDERVARSIAEQRADLSRQKESGAARRISLEEFHQQMLAGEKSELNVIVKADVQGSADVLESSLAKVGNEEVSVKLVHSGVGGINESDVILASASDAVIIGFHVTANQRAQRLAEQEGVDIRTYRVIYEAIADIKAALEGLLAPETKEVVTGHAEIRAVFRSSALGNIAGCYVQDGEVTRDSLVRIIRDDVIVHDGKIDSLRREKDDVRAVQNGYECGIKIDRFDDIKEGDVIEAYKQEEVAPTLS